MIVKLGKYRKGFCKKATIWRQNNWSIVNVIKLFPTTLMLHASKLECCPKIGFSGYSKSQEPTVK
jgi:hypothetical protein